MGARRVLVGRIVAAHGVRGWVKLQSFTETPEAVGSYGVLEDEAGQPVRLSLKGRSKEAVLAAIQGVETRDAAEALKGRGLYVPRSALPDPGDEVYVADLLGVTVRDGAGQALGRIVAVQDFGAGPLLEVEPEGGGETVLVPFTGAVVPVLAPEYGFVVVDLPPGLWPGAESKEEAEENGGAA